MEQTSTQIPTQIDFSPVYNNIKKEREMLQSEIDAFKAFLERLKQIPVRMSQSPIRAPSNTTLLQPSSSHATREKIQAAYRETVLSVKHWTEEYGAETTIESMKEEFSPEFADRLTTGPTAESPRFQSKIVQACKKPLPAERIPTR